MGIELQVELLGPVAARTAGRELPLGSRMPRTLLAALAADAGRPVQVESLVERLWGERSPERPRHALHVYVGRVRAALGDAAVVRRSGGYLLDVSRLAVDVHLFRDLAAAGDLDAALDLPRGVPLEDLAGPWAERTRHAWERLHADVAIAWARREAAAGDPYRALGRLGDLCDRYPYAEPLSAALMVALAATGRRAEALERFARTRRRLRDDLGTEPGSDLRTAHLTLLRT